METGYFFPLFYFFFGAFVFFLDSPAHIRATAEDRFQMRVKTPVATAFLCWHDSHASLTRSSQNLPSPPPSVTGSDAAQLKSRGSNHLPPRQRRRRLVLAGGARETEWWCSPESAVLSGVAEFTLMEELPKWKRKLPTESSELNRIRGADLRDGEHAEECCKRGEISGLLHRR